MIIIEQLNKDFILRRRTEEDIFCYYMGIDKIDEKKSYRNDRLRIDPKPGCRFYRNKNSGILYFRDFGWKHFDCFSYVSALYGLEFNETIYKIAVDLNLLDNNNNTKVIDITRYKNLPVVGNTYDFELKNWNTKLINYWKKYISWVTIEDLEYYNIRPLYRYYINKELKYTVSDKEIAFLYQLDKYKFQVYAPFRLSNMLKFLTTDTKVIGLKTLNYNKKYVAIIKSYKDFALARLLKFNNIGILGETMFLDLDAELAIDGFPYKFTLFDNDWAGKRASIVYKQKYNTIPLLFPKDLEKDLSDNLEKYGENDIYQLAVEVAEKYEFEL